MACSKLFSGNLPEISSDIIQNLRNNINTLYSFWCRLAIPLLWEDPFSMHIRYQENLPSHFLDTYFLSLNDSDKSKLNEIKPYKFEHEPLFNYPSLIRTLDFSRVQLHAEKLFHTASYNTTSTTSTSSSKKKLCLPTCLQNESMELVTCVDYEKSKVICIALLKLFIENDASLNSLYISISDTTRHFFNYICEYCDINNSKFISEIEILSFDYYDCWISSSTLKTFQEFLSFLPSLSTSIKHIEISSDRPEFNQFFANIIQSQSQLSSIRFTEVLEILNPLKHSSNTLTSITFHSCQFSNAMRFNAFSYLTQLESLQFKYCPGLNSNVIQPLLNITTPLKIKTFVIIDNIYLFGNGFNPISLLIQKIGSYLKNLVLYICEDELRRKLFDTIIDFCKEVKFLCLGYIDFINIPQLPKIISNFNLKYLTLIIKYHGCNFNSTDNENNLKISSMILRELGKLSPSLHYLDLSLVINPDDLQTAFENCKHVELKKLLIKNWSRNNNVDTTLKVIKDFVKEKKLEFLAYYIVNKSLLVEKEVCCKNLEKLVEEIQSSIKMVKYDDLAIKVSEIDGDLIVG